ncbi:MAG: RDD family protein [Gordonia sp. (in: high G+C Gram-positive bacteria)]|uniref:RDD family protein n=1 Tax=Gordonia sp. (in: high G+C Gram-positive bacteria) TaxID=84139 RepID=UPI0039E3C960
MRDAAGSWLTGPYIAHDDVEYRGADLGLPKDGPGAIAGGWLRVVALLVDWLIAAGIAFLVVGPRDRYVDPATGHVFSAFEVTVQAMSWWQFGTWFVVGVLAVALFGFTPGQFVAGTRVVRADLGPERGAAEAAGDEPRAAVGPLRALFRQVLIPFVVPALINDYNGRAMHDRVTGTAVVRSR